MKEGKRFGLIGDLFFHFLVGFLIGGRSFMLRLASLGHPDWRSNVAPLSAIGGFRCQRRAFGVA